MLLSALVSAIVGRRGDTARLPADYWIDTILGYSCTAFTYSHFLFLSAINMSIPKIMFNRIHTIGNDHREEKIQLTM